MSTKTSEPATSRAPSPAPAQARSRTPARDRLLAAADELFYEEGVHTVGIDRVIEKAGVAKATLYSTFGSKDELIRAYLKGRHESRRERIAKRLAEIDDPRDRLLAVFDAQGELFAQPGFHGCAFVNATAESMPGSAAEEATLESRAWMRSLLTDLARDAGVPGPAEFARQLLLLYDGANISARVDRDPTAAASARAVAAMMLDAVTAH
jgi:AcrR family transcriptional regulator